MSRVNWIILTVVVAILVGLGWWFAPRAPLQDPSISRNFKILQCDGKFTANYTVKNNHSIQQRYNFTTSQDNNFDPDPPVVSPRNRRFGVNEESSEVDINGSLVDACDDGMTTLHIEAANISGISNDFDNTFGPTSVEGNPPENQPATPNFSYTFTLSCCANVNGIFRIRDSGSEHIDALRYTPNSINCPIDVTKDIAVTGVLEQNEVRLALLYYVLF